jgi:glycosyltransferase involved in cell wall biosynthesis
VRILQISQKPQRRGAEVFARQLSQELRRRGHEVAIVYLYPDRGTTPLPVDPEDIQLGGDEMGRLETTLGVNPALLARLRTAIERFRPDVIQVNGARTVKYGVLAKLLKRGRGAPVVYRNIGAPGVWLRGIRRRLFYFFIMRWVDGVVAISHRSREAMRGMLSSGLPATTIFNAVEPRELRPSRSRQAVREEAETPLTAPVVLYVGNLSAEKRVDRLIEVVRQARVRVPELHLWLVGSGPLRGELERQVQEAGLHASTRFFGSQESVASFLAAADLLALMSDTEGIPAVLLEAGFLGVPTLVTRVGSVDECVIDGETGVLVNPEDTGTLVETMVRLLSDPDLRAKMGRRAHDWIDSGFTMERITSQYLDFYAAVAAGGETRSCPPDRPRAGPPLPASLPSRQR